MRILIVNDDGAGAAQLVPLIKWCQKLGEVTTVVPKYEQSGKSHCIELHQSFEVLQVELAPGVPAYTVDSAPADCVRFAVLGLKMNFDLVISGINRGFNMGTDIMYPVLWVRVLKLRIWGFPLSPCPPIPAIMTTPQMSWTPY